MGIIEGILKALQYLFITGVLYLAWRITYDFAQTKGFKEMLFKGFLWCVAVALVANIYLGTHSGECDDEWIRPSCDTVVDYTPTINERMATFLYYLVLLYPAVVLGTYHGNQKRQITERLNTNFHEYLFKDKP